MKKLIYTLVASYLLLTACTERIDIEVDQSYKRLVVEGYLTLDSVRHMVKLSKSADFFDGTEMPPVENATVYIGWDNSSVLLTEEEPGMYFTPDDFFTKEKTVYTLDISNVDVDGNGTNETYTARDSMARVLPIDSVRLDKVQFGPPENPQQFVRVLLYAWEPPERNFYIFKALRNGEPLDEGLTDWNLSNDELFNGNYTSGTDVKWINQSDSTLLINNGDIITLELIQITQDYFTFLNGANLESFGSFPLFSGPPANIQGNISNGALGYFATWATSRSDAVYKEIE